MTARSLVFAAALVGMVTGCEQKADSPAVASDSVAIRAVAEQMSAEHVAATTRGDAAGALAMMSADVVRYEPNSPPQRGRDAAVATLQPYLDSVASLTNETIVYAHASGDLGVAVGTWSEDATVKTTQAKSRSNGYWVTLMRRQPDGSWKVTHNMATVVPSDSAR